MELTLGQLYFYGGIAGMVCTGVAAIVAIVLLSGSKKRLEKKLEAEYGR